MFPTNDIDYLATVERDFTCGVFVLNDVLGACGGFGGLGGVGIAGSFGFLRSVVALKEIFSISSQKARTAVMLSSIKRSP
jgi:hypothetical protein